MEKATIIIPHYWQEDVQSPTLGGKEEERVKVTLQCDESQNSMRIPYSGQTHLQETQRSIVIIANANPILYGLLLTANVILDNLPSPSIK